MRKSLSQWLMRRPAVPGWGALAAACPALGWSPKLTHEHDGFVIESPASAPAWRLEWGAAQRSYIGQHELRLRGETGLDPLLYALLMPRALMAQLEREVYNQFVEGVQTRLDEQTPEEMRWLAMSERLSGAALGPLGPHLAAVGNDLDWLAAWLSGPLEQALLDWHHLGPTAAGADEAAWPAMALMLRRSQLVWRVHLPQPDAPALLAAVQVFETALAQAIAVPPALPE